MKANERTQLNSRTPQHRNMGVSVVRHPMTRMARWFERNVFRIDIYELRGDEIIPARPREIRFRVEEISSWQQVFLSLGVPIIVIKFNDGRRVELSDKHEDLRRILQDVATGRELPWDAI
ncbi:MAG: hypothetical protein PHR35_14205 [Kiritimatiellae bacterium]|nr:hypothetical protein [Kiritimatiellia bacterium]